MTDPFALANEVLYDSELGLDATYTPQGGSPVLIRVLPSRPDEVIDFGGRSSVLTSTAVWRIEKAAVSNPQEGDTLEVDGVTYTIQGKPRLDKRQLNWSVDSYEV